MRGRLQRLQGAAALTLVAVSATFVMAADHADGPSVKADPAADITDVFAWMSSDASKMNLVMDVFPSATTGSKFSDQVQYVFHTTSKTNALSPTGTDKNVICTFDAAQTVSCWAGTSFVTGDASQTGGITSSDGKLQVFAGLRDDPFFFNLTGFNATRAAVTQAVASGTLQKDAAGCPTLDQATSQALVNQLKSGTGGAAAADDFANKNVLALVVQLDKSLVTQGGPVVEVWGSTNRK